jgi:GTP-binding protein
VLGVVALPDGRSFVVADLPGLIEGASAGAGLGHQFLRHVIRTQVLIHVVDLAAGGAADLEAVNRELWAYDPQLRNRPMVIALNKIDQPQAKKRLEEVAGALTSAGLRVAAISAATGEGVAALLRIVANLLDEVRVRGGTTTAEAPGVSLPTPDAV